MKTASAIAKARKARGLTQAELAKIVGVSPGTVAAWETSRHGVRVGRVREVAKALGLDVAELVA